MTIKDRFLLVAPQSPFGEASGAQQRTRLFYDALCQHGPTDVLVISRDPDDVEVQRDPEHENVVLVRSMRGNLTSSPYRPDPELTQRAARLLPVSLNSYRLVVGRHLWYLCQLDLRRSQRTIVDLDDFSYRFSRHALSSPSVWRMVLQRRLQEFLARRQLARFDGFVFVSERDRAVVPERVSAVCPNVTVANPSMSLVPGAGDVRSLLFVGSMWYRPNCDGINWFLRHVWPSIRREVADARLTIVGAAGPSRRAEWEQFDGVSAPGFVDDLAEAYAAATGVIVPIQYGGGTNIKLLEGLVHGKACVSSAFAHAPFRQWLQEGTHLMVAGNAAAFARRCVDVLEQPTLEARLGRDGRAQVLQSFSADRFRSEFDALLSRMNISSARPDQPGSIA